MFFFVNYYLTIHIYIYIIYIYTHYICIYTLYILCVHDIYIYIHCIYYVYMYIYIYSNQQKHYPAKISKIVGHCVSFFFLGGGAIGSIRYFQLNL